MRVSFHLYFVTWTKIISARSTTSSGVATTATETTKKRRTTISPSPFKAAPRERYFLTMTLAD